MKINRKVKVAVAGVSIAALSSLALVGPGAVAAGEIPEGMTVVNTETIQVLMDAEANISAKRIYDQLIVTGEGDIEVLNPVIEDGLRNLDRFGGLDVEDGYLRLSDTVDGKRTFRTVSNFTADLPISVKVAYFMDGFEVKPGDIVGKNGKVDVRWTVRNNTGTPQEIYYTDGDGNQVAVQESVVIPMVGSLSTTLPKNFTNITTTANTAGDGKGGTTLSFTMTLFRPLGNETAEFGYSATVEDGVIPPATISILPINPLENTSFKSGSASLKSGASTGQSLAAGAIEIDSNLLKLQEGAQGLVDGLFKLDDGSAKLRAGLKELNAGVNGGDPNLEDGVGQLAAGSATLASAAGSNLELLEAVRASLMAGQTAPANLSTMVPLQVLFGAQPNDLLVQFVEGATGSSTLGAVTGLTHITVPPPLQVANTAAHPVFGAGVREVPCADQPFVLAGQPLITPICLAYKIDAGAGQIEGGLDSLNEKVGPLSDGIAQLYAGSKQLNDGLGQASAGAPALPEGAGRLSEEGMSLLINAGNLTAANFGTQYALIEAGSARYAESMPVGGPEGATTLAAYKFELAGDTGQSGANLWRTILAAVLFAAAVGAGLVFGRRAS